MAPLAEALRDRPGGITRLAAFLTEHGSAVEADLHRYYTLDLLDLWRPGGHLSWRKLGSLVSHLPPESATMTALRHAHPDLAEEAAEAKDPGSGSWSADQMLLAALVDAVRHLSWMYASVHAKTPPPMPEPVPRPGVQPPQRKTMTVAAYRALTGEDPPLRLVSGGGEDQRR